MGNSTLKHGFERTLPLFKILGDSYLSSLIHASQIFRHAETGEFRFLNEHKKIIPFVHLYDRPLAMFSI
jgi:hypothetical protein